MKNNCSLTHEDMVYYPIKIIRKVTDDGNTACEYCALREICEYGCSLPDEHIFVLDIN